MDRKRIDILNRDKFVDDVFSVIETLADNRKSCTFAINGEWGSGKSFVLDMLEERLSIQQSEETASDKYAIFHYNCWQYDYYEEPLYAIVSSMYDWIKSNESEFAKKAKNILLYVLIAFGLTTKDSVNNVIKLLTDMDFSQINKDTKETIEKINTKGKLDDGLYTVQESIVFTRNLISKITEDQTVIIVVDELDRCLPEYAIKVLERLHHLFDGIDNLIVILAVDKEHLNNTVCQIFGFNSQNSEKDINSYLAKFIDFELQLDNGTVDENYKYKYPEYYSRFITDNNTILSFDEIISSLLDPFEPRKRDRIFKKAELIHNMVFDEKVDISIMLAELLFVSYSFTKQPYQFINKNTFLYDRTNKTFPRFAELFKNTIVYKANLSLSRNVQSGEVVFYYAKAENNSSAQLLYYISCHKSFTIRLNVNDDYDKIIYKNGEKIKKFYELIDIIE